MADFGNVIQALELMCEPSISNQQRQEMYKLTDQYKINLFELSHLTLLFSPTNHINVKIFALQCLEYTIKHKWPKMKIENKCEIKEALFNLSSASVFTDCSGSDSNILQLSLAQNFVHLIKCEWPQQWPNMMQELMSLASAGLNQKKLVLSIFLRLSQDVVCYQNVPPQRKKDILFGLTENIDIIFSFTLQSIVYHLESYKSNNLNGISGPDHLTVCREAIQTLIGFVDWVRLDLYCGKIEGSSFFRLLTNLLVIAEVGREAAELLLVALSRKLKSDERECLLRSAFEDAQAFSCLHSAVTEMFREPSALIVYSDKSYVLTHRLSEIVCRLGVHIATAWDSKYSSTPPANFQAYLQCLLLFTQHPIRMIAGETYDAWIALFKVTKPNLITCLQPHITTLFKTWTVLMQKNGFPSENSPSGLFSRNMYEDSDYIIYFGRYRADVLRCLSAITHTFPEQVFSLMIEWLSHVASLQVLPDDLDSNSICRLESRIVLEWDAVTVSAEAIMSSLIGRTHTNQSQETNGTSPANPVIGSEWTRERSLPERFPSGCSALTALVNHPIEDPQIRIHILSTLALLFPFAAHNQDLVIQVLQKVISVNYFDLPGQNKYNRARCVRNLRLHAAACLIRMARDNADDLMPVFDKLFEFILELWGNVEVSLLEKSVLVEAIVMLSYKLENFDRQKSVLERILAPVTDLLASPHIQAAIETPPVSLVTYIGLGESALEETPVSQYPQNRGNIATCVMTFVAALKRSKVPEDMEVCRQRGFLQMSNGTERLRHPLGAILLPILPCLFKLIKAFNTLWGPETSNLRHPDNTGAFSLSETNKAILLGRYQAPITTTEDTQQKKNGVDHLRNFMNDINDQTLHLVALSCQVLGFDLYSHPNIASLVLSFIFASMDHLPDLRVHAILKIFMRTYIKNCPEECIESSLVPVVEQILGAVFQRLKVRWETVKLTNEEDYEGEVTDEVIEEYIVRFLTRTVMDTVKLVLSFSGKSSSCSGENPVVEGPGDGEMEEGEHEKPVAVAGLGRLGRSLIESEEGALWLLSGLCEAITWPDSVVCLKAAECAGQILDHSLDKVTNEVASHMLLSVLKGLHVNGQNRELNLTFLLRLGVTIYEKFRPAHTQLAHLLTSVTGQPPEIIQKLDEKLFRDDRKPVNDRVKRDAFMKVVSSIVGVALSERFKDNVLIRNLPPLTKPSKKAETDILSLDAVDSSDISGLTSLFTQS